MIDTTPRRDFLLGEEKYIDFRIASHKEQPVIIAEAYYTLTEGDQIVDQGACEIDGAYISVFLNPKNRGSYILEIRYTVSPETRKIRMIVNVN